MTEQLVADEKLDGLDIVSIGKLYEGPLEKKYWSSSRGKDRHPYPVGYAALRNNNGNTYKMSILEGLKGPEFTISSTDGQSCSGQTPDIAWEGFQKKSCARIKIMRGKRFSGKINGAELFGFKNPLVMRLLRGLKANGSQITEQNLPLSSFGNGKSEVTHENHCDLEVNLVTTQGREKRSKKRKEINVKPVSVDEHKRRRSQELAVSGDGAFRSQSENHTFLESCNEIAKSHILSAKDGLQFDSSISSEQLDKEKLLHVKETSNFVGSKDLIYIEEGTKLLITEENLDNSMLNRTPETTSSKTVDEKVDQPFQKESQMLDTVDLYAPDTLDLTLDSTCNLEVEIPKETTCTINGKLDSSQVLVSEKCKTESQSKEGMFMTAGSDNSEKSDSDPVGQEIANSMMTLLLPRALPLLKTFSRKKKSSTNCGKKDVHGMSHLEREGTDQCRKDEHPANSSEKIQLEKLRGKVQISDKCYTENLNIKKQKEDLIIPSTDVSSAVAGLDDSTTIAPDTFENDQCEVTEYSQAGQLQDANGVYLCTRKVHHVFPNNQPTEEAEGVGILSLMLTVDHVVQKGISDGNVSILPTCRDPRGDFVNKTCSASNVSTSDILVDKMRPVEQAHILQLDRIPTGSNDTSCPIATVPAHQDDVLFLKYKDSSDVCGESVKCEGQSQAFGYTELFETQVHHEVDSSVSVLQAQRIIQDEKTNFVHVDEEAKVAPNDELENIFELLSCYGHPTPISMVMLRTNGNEVFVCVLCGSSMEMDITLFFYKTSIKGEMKGCPSFIGHTTIVSPISANASRRQVLLDSSSLQFTPDGICLVLLNNIKVPYCREGSVNCSCSVCTSDCFERNAVKVVQVKLGYVQVVCKLKTTNDVCSILVCEPNYLVAAEDGGKMNLWTMNSPWSTPTDQSCLPPSDCMPNCIVQMKRIPNFPALVVGQSAFGDFFLWDLTRRILVSKFSAPITSSLPFIPINVFRCPSQESFTTDACRKKEVADIMEETQRCILEEDKHGSLPVNEDLSLVLFVASVPNHDLHDDYLYKGSGVTPGGCWSLALLAKSKLVSENTLDPSATVAGAAAGYGIIGTCDGSLYIWELSTGTKLGYLSHHKGATVSCLAIDDSDFGAFAVAVNDSQLQVYVPGNSPNKNQE